MFDKAFDGDPRQRAILFLGRSGTGKSITAASLLPQWPTFNWHDHIQRVILFSPKDAVRDKEEHAELPPIWQNAVDIIQRRNSTSGRAKITSKLLHSLQELQDVLQEPPEKTLLIIDDLQASEQLKLASAFQRFQNVMQRARGCGLIVIAQSLPATTTQERLQHPNFLRHFGFVAFLGTSQPQLRTVLATFRDISTAKSKTNTSTPLDKAQDYIQKILNWQVPVGKLMPLPQIANVSQQKQGLKRIFDSVLQINSLSAAKRDIAESLKTTLPLNGVCLRTNAETLEMPLFPLATESLYKNLPLTWDVFGESLALPPSSL